MAKKQKPWINNYGQQQNSNSPAVDDLYKSPNVFINGIPVVLYAPPESDSALINTGSAGYVGSQGNNK